MSSAITPAVTLDSTASMKARRVSSWALAVRSSLVCSSSRPAIRLKAVASVWISSSVPVDRDPRREVALLDPPGGADQLPDRPDHAVRKLQRSEDRETDNDQTRRAASAALNFNWLARDLASKRMMTKLIAPWFAERS